MKDKMSIRRANKLLTVACELYPELKDRNITITQDSKGVFYASVGTNRINITDKVRPRKLREKLIKYIYDTFKLSIDDVESFAVLHEIGHLYHKYMWYNDDAMNMYDLHKINVDNDISYDNFNNYREIDYEFLEDSFAVDVIDRYYRITNKI